MKKKQLFHKERRTFVIKLKKVIHLFEDLEEYFEKKEEFLENIAVNFILLYFSFFLKFQPPISLNNLLLRNF